MEETKEKETTTAGKNETKASAETQNTENANADKKNKEKGSKGDKKEKEKGGKGGKGAKGGEGGASATVEAASEDKKLDVKVVKGARDFEPIQMAIRNKVFKTITDVFKKHGAVEIDTPVFELKETLTGKYGEDSKLIYDLKDQGGEILALRYDLTVPFARYMATTNNVPGRTQAIKRYHIGKVYRRDSPQTSKGRFREFFQCDFDIAGNKYGRMIADSEIIKVVVEILTELPLGQFSIKINHRKILDSIVEFANISADKFKIVCSSVDKLDKEPWEAVRKELLSKEITEEQADKLWTYVQLKDKPWEMYKKLVVLEEFIKTEKAKEALEDMRILFEYCDIFQVTNNLSFDLSLARGLDYYTGLIYEAVLEGSGLGSIAGGGRYDELVGMFYRENISSVGVSIGVERVFSILEEKYKNDPSVRPVETEVLIAVMGKNIVKERLEIANELWSNGIKAEFNYSENPRKDKQLDYALENRIPFVIFIGDNEIKEKKVSIKSMANSKQEDFSRDVYIEALRKMLSDPSLLVVAPHQPHGKGKK